jgi:hypothetical protein
MEAHAINARPRLWEVAQAQYGLLSASQCEALGLSRQFIYGRVSSGAWQKVHRGVFKTGADPMSRLEKDLAALLRMGDAAVLTHQSAARCLGLDVQPTDVAYVTLPVARRAKGESGIQVWRSRDLNWREVVVRGALRYTRVDRTVLDLAAVLEDRWLRAVVDSALRRWPQSLAWMTQTYLRIGAGHRGAERLGRLLRTYGSHEDVPDSVLESFALQLTSALGKRPIVHHCIVEGARLVAEVDLAWPDEKLCVELDSWKHHGSKAAFGEDRARDRALVALGWVVLRYTWEDVTRAPERLVAELADALNRGSNKSAALGARRCPS